MVGGGGRDAGGMFSAISKEQLLGISFPIAGQTCLEGLGNSFTTSTQNCYGQPKEGCARLEGEVGLKKSAVEDKMRRDEER